MKQIQKQIITESDISSEIKIKIMNMIEKKSISTDILKDFLSIISSIEKFNLWRKIGEKSSNN